MMLGRKIPREDKLLDESIHTAQNLMSADQLGQSGVEQIADLLIFLFLSQLNMYSTDDYWRCQKAAMPRNCVCLAQQNNKLCCIHPFVFKANCWLYLIPS